MNQMIIAAAEHMQPGVKFKMRMVDAEEVPTGEILDCVVMKQYLTGEYAGLVAAINAEPTFLDLTSDLIEGSIVVTAIGVNPQDAAADYGCTDSLSSFWEGALFVILD